MKTLSASAVLWLWFALMGQPPGDRAPGAALIDPLPEHDAGALAAPLAARDDPADTADLTAVVQRYCVRCHNERLLRGNLTLETFDVVDDEGGTGRGVARRVAGRPLAPAPVGHGFGHG